MGKYRIRPGRFIPALIITLCVAGLFLWGLWTALAWAKSAVLVRLLDFRFLARDEIIETVAADGLVIRREELLKAPASGELKVLVRDGERLRVGSPLAEIRGVMDSTITSPRAGVFSSHVDGLESLLVPDMLGELDLAAVEKIKKDEPPAKNKVYSGQFFGKVVDNLHPVYVYLGIDNPTGDVRRSFENRDTAYLVLKDREWPVKVEDVFIRDDKLNLLVEIRDYPDELVHRRELDIELVARRLSGWLVPRQAVVFKDGEPGIYVASRQRIHWIPVSVRDRLGDTVSVTGGHLDDSVRYISNPGWAREGARLGSGG
ncbi:MAG: hypothetical protein MJA84_13000 [Firmicutes bacterium]|nr:hypothetical protein [Bacillota bacterium]